MSVAYCTFTHCGGLLVQRMDSLGRIADHCERCERRLRGVCRDCSAPVEGMIGRAVRCAPHKRAARIANDRKRMRDPGVRRDKNARTRKYARRAEVRERKRRNRRAWARRNPDNVKRHRRKYLLKQSPAYLATQRRHNADPVRKEKKRRAALARYYEIHPVRPDPKCSGCGTAILWTGSGRPRLTCDSCCTPSELRRRQRGDNSATARAERVA